MMRPETIEKKLMADGFDKRFSHQAVTWFLRRFSDDFRRAVKDPVKMIKDNEYAVRNWFSR